jgi:signal transduction histidine kinase
MAYLEMGEPLLAYVDDPNIPATKRQYMLSFGGFTSLVIPLQAGGKTIAYTEIWESQERREYSPEEIHLCQDIAQQAAVTIENARLFKGIADERGRLQALIESDRDGIILISVQGQILVINQPALAFMHMKETPDYWIKRPVMSMIKHLRRHAPPLAQTAVTEMRRIIQGHLDTNEGQYELAPRAVHWRSLPVMADEDEIGRLLVLRDITEERLLEKMQDDLTHTMVHDLRSPLTSISITLDLLDLHLGDSANPKIERTLERARQSTVRMLAMVNAILDISRLESGHMELSYKPSTLNNMISTVIDMQSPQALEKNLQLKQVIPKDLPMVWIDSALVERVLQNLVGNAIKFTPEEGAVQITAVINEAEPDSILISVSDTGAGVPKEIRNRLFEKFTTGGQRERGSGLGLAFCKMAIEAHGQRIWLANSSEKGTTFQFTLSFSPPNGRSA